MTDTRESLDEQLSKAYDRATAEPEAESAPEVVADDAAPVADTPENAPEGTEDKPNRERDENGRYKSKATEQAADAPPEAINSGKDDEAGRKPEEPKPETVAATPAIAPPVALPEAAKAEWGKTPPAIQQAVLKRENDIARYVQQTSTQLKQFEAINQQIEPVRKELESFYGDVPTGLKTLFSISDYATKSPYEYIRWFAQQRGLDAQQVLNVFAGGQAPQAQAAFNPQLAALSQRVSAQEERTRHEESQRLAARDAEAANAIREFESKPENKFIEQVREDMAALLSNGLASSLQDAYEKAIWQNPTIRQQIVAEQIATQDAKRKAEADKMAKKASTAAAMAQATKGGAIGSPKDKPTADDILSATYDRLHGAA